MADKQQVLTDEIRGSKYLVQHCNGALESLKACVSRIDPRKRAKQEAWLHATLIRIANGERMSSQSLAPESKLPDDSKFYALKKIPTRGYMWLSNRIASTWFISHYVHKDYQKLRAADIDRVHANWKRIERGGESR